MKIIPATPHQALEAAGDSLFVLQRPEFVNGKILLMQISDALGINNGSPTASEIETTLREPTSDAVRHALRFAKITNPDSYTEAAEMSRSRRLP